MTTRADVAAFIGETLDSNKYIRRAVFIASRRAS
jgi:hypothetical protein